MSDRSDLERDIAEEDELRALLRAGDHQLFAAPFDQVEERTHARRSEPALTGVALAVLVIVAVVGIGVWRIATPTTPASPAISPSPSRPVATALPQVGPPASPVVGLCPEPPGPAYVPWTPTQRGVTTSTRSTETLVFGPGTGATQSVVRVLVEPYSDAQPTTNPQTAGGRTVFVYVAPATVGKPAEARAWWREPTGTCPLVTVALVSPDQDPSTQLSDLLRIVASIPSFAASPTPTARSIAGYGVLIRRPDGRIDLLHEGGSAPTTLDTRADVLAVSPDGRDIAYWGGPDARELWIAPARAFQEGRILLTLANERGTGIVWSPDGGGLMFAAASTTFGPGPLAAPTYAALRVITFVGPPDPRELARIDTGQVVRPLAWDGSRGIGAAEEGEGQKGPGRYIVVANHTIVTGGTKDSNIRFVDLPDALAPNVAIGHLQASGDARFVMATWHYSDRDLVRFWPIEGLDMGLLRELAPEHAGDRISDAVWRPKSIEIGVNTAGQFQLWTLDGQRRQVRGLAESVTSSFRYDGSALYSTTIGNGQLELSELIAPFGTRQLPPAPGPALASVELGGVR